MMGNILLQRKRKFIDDLNAIGEIQDGNPSFLCQCFGYYELVKRLPKHKANSILLKMKLIPQAVSQIR